MFTMVDQNANIVVVIKVQSIGNLSNTARVGSFSFINLNQGIEKHNIAFIVLNNYNTKNIFEPSTLFKLTKDGQHEV